MKEKKVTVSLEQGLDSRKAAMFVQEAICFDSRVFIIMDSKQVNAKSIMGVLSLGLLDHEEILLRAEGTDEEQAVETLGKLLESHQL